MKKKKYSFVHSPLNFRTKKSGFQKKAAILCKRLHCLSTKVTIKDIARVLNTTEATVSRALNNHPGISIKRKELVLHTARRLNYRQNKIASSLRSGKTNTIGVIIPSAQMNFFGSVVFGIETKASLNGYSVLLYQSNEDPAFEKKALDAFMNARVDGIMASIAKNTFDFSHYEHIKHQKIPLVFFDRTLDQLNVPSVVVNDFDGGYKATEHLIQQGFRRIAHISGPSHLQIFNNRFLGYKAALEHYGLMFDKKWVVPGQLSIETGRKAMRDLLGLKQKPDAVFAVEDFTALGAIKELKDQKIAIPGEMGVIGFANEIFSEHISPSLSTINQQTVKMGEEAFALLLNLMNGEVLEKLKTKVILDALPVFRESSTKILLNVI